MGSKVGAKWATTMVDAKVGHGVGAKLLGWVPRWVPSWVLGCVG